MLKRILLLVTFFTVSTALAADLAQWEVVEKSSLGKGMGNAAWYSYQDSSGIIYQSGWGNSPLDKKNPEKAVGYWIIKKSEDQGHTWKNIFSEKYKRVRAFGVHSDGKGRLVSAAGVVPFGQSTVEWVVRLSQDAGQTWDLIEPGFKLTQGKQATGYGAYLVGDQHIISMGSATDQNDITHFLIRKYNLKTKEWKTVDDLAGMSVGDSAAGPITVDYKTGRMYIAGWWRDASNQQSLIVKHSDDQGETWALNNLYTTDEPQAKKYLNYSYSMTLDENGNVYLSGVSSTKGEMKSQGILWRMNPQTKKWEVLDQHQPRNKYLGPLSFKASAYTGVAVKGQTIVTVGTWISFNPITQNITFRSLIRRSLDSGKTWEFLEKPSLGEHGDGVQYNNVYFNQLGELVVSGEQMNKKTGDEWFVKILK